MKRLVPCTLALFLAACATSHFTIQHDPNRPVAVSEASEITRGKSPAYRSPVTIENVQTLDDATYRDLRMHFLEPLQTGPWRYVVDGITLNATAEQVADWTLLIALDTGARIKVENFGEWDERSGSRFAAGYQEAQRALAQIRREDAALDRYLRHWTGARKPRARHHAAAVRMSR